MLSGQMMPLGCQVWLQDGALVQSRKRPPFLWQTQSITRVCGQRTKFRLAFDPLCVRHSLAFLYRAALGDGCVCRVWTVAVGGGEGWHSGKRLHRCPWRRGRE